MIKFTVCLLSFLFSICFSEAIRLKVPKVPTIQEITDSSDIIITIKVIRIKFSKDFYVGHTRNEIPGGIKVTIFGKITKVFKGFTMCQEEGFLSFQKQWDVSVVYDSLGGVTEIHKPFDYYSFTDMKQITDETFKKINTTEPGRKYLCFLDVNVASGDTSFVLNRIDPAENICYITSGIVRYNTFKEYCDTVGSQKKKRIDEEIEKLKAKLDTMQQYEEKH